MKLTSKLLTALSFTVIGVSTPIAISSCSCSNSYVIKYGDKINCKDKNNKEVKYHSINDVKNAAKTHVQPVEGTTAPLSWDVALSDLKNYNSEKMQQFYWDLVYSAAEQNIEYTLIWTVNSTEQKITFNGTEYSKIEYAKENNTWVIKGNGTNKICNSYSLRHHN